MVGFCSPHEERSMRPVPDGRRRSPSTPRVRRSRSRACSRARPGSFATFSRRRLPPSGTMRLPPTSCGRRTPISRLFGSRRCMRLSRSTPSGSTLTGGPWAFCERGSSCGSGSGLMASTTSCSPGSEAQQIGSPGVWVSTPRAIGCARSSRRSTRSGSTCTSPSASASAPTAPTTRSSTVPTWRRATSEPSSGRPTSMAASSATGR